MIYRLLILVLFFVLSQNIFAQVKTEKVSHELIPAVIQDSKFAKIEIKIANEEEVLIELENSVLGSNSEKNSFDFGKFFPFALDFDNISSSCIGQFCYKEVIVSYPGMNTMGFNFELISLSSESEFYIINDEFGYVQGPITKSSLFESKDFISGLMPGDELRLLLKEPIEEKNQSKVIINQASFGIFDFFEISRYSSRLNSSSCFGFGCSGSCNSNIACNSALDLESKAVALVLIKNINNNNYSYRATGSLINNGAQDNRFLFLTAAHIYNSFEWDNRSQFVFHYKSTQCSPTTNGALTVYVQGAYNTLSGQANTDLKLVELKVGQGANPLFSNNPVSYLGWSIIDEITAVNGIHHPKGDVQKLFTGTNVQIYNENISGSTYNYWRFDMASGIFEPVSSGSPILNVSERLIGTLRGKVRTTPPFACGSSNNGAIAGRLSSSWSVLCQFLDPNNEGITAMNSKLYSGGPVTKVFPEAIGPDKLCGSESFTLSNAPLDLGVSWDVIQGANLISGSTSGTGKTAVLTPLNQIVSGNARIRFTVSNICGSKQYIKNFWVGKPSSASGIQGGTLVYEGMQVVYSVPTVSGADSYNWTLPSGWSGGGNGLGNSITVTVGPNSGNVRVVPSNSCGQGRASILSVTVDNCQTCRKVTLVPNPANRELNLIPKDPRFNEDEEFRLKEYNIFDLSGKLLKSVYTNEFVGPNRIIVADLPKGIYFVHFVFEDGVLVKKVIIER